VSLEKSLNRLEYQQLSGFNLKSRTKLELKEEAAWDASLRDNKSGTDTLH
jgi:hypothetical protein